MTKQVALSEEAYRALRQRRRDSESFSQAIMRLLDTVQRHERDPRAFTRRRHRFLLDADSHLKEAEKGRDGEDPWDAGA
jgi:predicted CopG family antitoxin